MSEVKCPPHAIVFDEDRGEYICTETGEVLEDHIYIYGPEWRFHGYGEFDARIRAGTPITNKVHDQGFHTEIDTRTRKGRILERRQKAIRVKSAREKRLARALRLMNETIGRLDLPNAELLKNEAGLIIRKLHSRKVIMNKNYRAIVAAAILIAANNLDTPVDKSVVLNSCEVTTTDVWKAQMKIRTGFGELIKVKPLDPLKFIDKMAYELGVSPKVKSLAIKIVSKAKKDGLTSGRGPRGVAAAALYIAALLLDERKTQKEVSDRVKVSEVTIRNRYRDLIDNLVIYVDV